MMSNLGAYQWFTSTGKKVGGAENLIALIATAGAAGGIFVFEGGKALIKKVKGNNKSKKSSSKSANVVYSITIPGESNEGLNFSVNDQFRVLESDGDAILIEKIGDTNNPYFVDKKLLTKISNYK